MTTVATSTQADQDTAHYRDVLNTLIDQGAALAARIAATATATTTPDSALPEAAIAFDRIARAVRRTIGLAQHIAANATPRHTATRATTRTRLIRGVEDAIHAKRRETDTESLTREFHERLEDPMLELDLEGRSIEDLIEEISRDLGIAQHDRPFVHKRRRPQDIADLRTRAHAPGLAVLTAPPPLGSHPHLTHHPRAHGPGPPKGPS